MPYLDDPVSLKLLAAGATFWVLLSIFIGNFEFLPHSLAYFPPPSSPNLGLNCSWGVLNPRSIHPCVVHFLQSKYAYLSDFMNTTV